MAPLKDTQNERDDRRLPIDRVGIKNLRHPLRIRDRDQSAQHTVATVSLAVDLPHQFKGTHMSRFVEVLNAHGSVIHVENLPDILREMQLRLHASAAHLEMRFPFFLTKKAPVSGKEGVMDYEVGFHATLDGSTLDFVLTVKANVTTLCPCSKSSAGSSRAARARCIRCSNAWMRRP